MGGGAHRTGTKVTQQGKALPIVQNVVRIQVAMNDPALVQVLGG